MANTNSTISPAISNPQAHSDAMNALDSYCATMDLLITPSGKKERPELCVNSKGEVQLTLPEISLVQEDGFLVWRQMPTLADIGTM